MKRITALSMFLVLSACAIYADGAKIAVYEPKAITEPGYYYLTQGIESSNNPVIDILSDNVTLDLNEYTVSSTVLTNVLIDFSDHVNVKIQNGRLSGGSTAVYSNGTVASSCSLKKLDISGTGNNGIDLTTMFYTEIESCYVSALSGTGISVSASKSPKGGRIAENTVVAGINGLYLDQMNGAAIELNQVLQFGTISPGSGIYLGGPDNIILKNTIKGGGASSAGLNISTAAYGSMIKLNTVSGNNGIGLILAGDCCSMETCVLRANQGGGAIITGDDCVLSESSFTGNTGDGINVSGERNLIEKNLMGENSGYGIAFDSSSLDNAYRNNMLRGNTTGTVNDLGTGNTDNGGNIL